MSGLSLNVSAITKRFGRKDVFEPVSFSASVGEVIILAGKNGSGKSTLLKILAGVLSPSSGTCKWSDTRKDVTYEAFQKRIGFVSPYLSLYNELSAIEHIMFVAELKDKSITRDQCVELLTCFGLDESIASSDIHVSKFSSGMQQRVRCAMAFACSPDVLFLDEPSSNLDDVGINLLFDTIRSFHGVIFIATNDEREKRLGTKVISL